MSPEYDEGLVSVIIPTYNRAHLVTEAMDSVWAQTYRPIELIVVDDGSTDNTSAVLKQWARAHSGDPRFELRTFRQENRGAPAARNLGLIESRGEYIQFIDSDDKADPRKATRSLEVLRETGADFVCCDLAIRDEGMVSTLEVWRFSRRNHTLSGHVNSICLNTFAPVYLRSACRNVGPWDEQLSIAQDFEYTARVLMSSLTGIWLPQLLYSWRRTPQGISTVERGYRGWASQLAACRAILKNARARGMVDRALRFGLGRRAATVSRQAALLGSGELSREAWSFTQAMLPPGRRFVHAVHRLVMLSVGPERLCRLGLM